MEGLANYLLKSAGLASTNRMLEVFNRNPGLARNYRLAIDGVAASPASVAEQLTRNQQQLQQSRHGVFVHEGERGLPTEYSFRPQSSPTSRGQTLANSNHYRGRDAGYQALSEMRKTDIDPQRVNAVRLYNKKYSRPKMTSYDKAKGITEAMTSLKASPAAIAQGQATRAGRLNSVETLTNKMENAESNHLLSNNRPLREITGYTPG